jgi:hypothetical protein
VLGFLILVRLVFVVMRDVAHTGSRRSCSGDKWALAGVPVLLGAVATPMSGIAALPAGWTLPGVAFLLFAVAPLLCGIAGLVALPGSRSCTVLNCRGGSWDG